LLLEIYCGVAVFIKKNLKLNYLFYVYCCLLGLCEKDVEFVETEKVIIILKPEEKILYFIRN